MKLTRLFVLIGSTFLLPLLSFIIGSAICEKPALADSLDEHGKPQEVLPQSLGESPHIEASPQSAESALGGSVELIHHRLPIESIRSTLDIRAESGAFRSLQIYVPEMEKDAFTLSLRHALTRTPESEFSLSLGFSYLDESLISAPPSPSSTGGPVSGPPPTPPPFPDSDEGEGSSDSPSSPPSRPDSRNRPRPPLADGPNSPSASADRESDAVIVRSPASPTNLQGPPPPSAFSSATRTGVLQFSQNYRHRDISGRWLARSQFNLGTELVSSPEPMNADAQFFSWTGRLERTQILDRNHQLTLQLETQLSPNNLLPAHQFKMKDRRFRSFERNGRPSEIAGNNGVRLRLEDRIFLVRSHDYPPAHTPPVQADRNGTLSVSLIPFVDMGYTWGQSNPRILSEQFLGRAGLSLSVQPLPELDIRFDYLRYWGDLQADSNDQDLYMTVGYQNAW